MNPVVNNVSPNSYYVVGSALIRWVHLPDDKIPQVWMNTSLYFFQLGSDEMRWIEVVIKWKLKCGLFCERIFGPAMNYRPVLFKLLICLYYILDLNAAIL